MGWREYGEPEPKGSVLAELLLGGLWGFMSVLVYGSIFVGLGWMTKTCWLITSMLAGLVAGSYFGWCFICSSKKKITTPHDMGELYETNGKRDE